MSATSAERRLDPASAHLHPLRAALATEPIIVSRLAEAD